MLQIVNMNFRNNEPKDWWNKISVHEKESINKGLTDARQGKLHPNSDAVVIYGKWL